MRCASHGTGHHVARAQADSNIRCVSARHSVARASAEASTTAVAPRNNGSGSSEQRQWLLGPRVVAAYCTSLPEIA
eukprot:1329910-Rhodomonas_salina.2